MPKVKAIVPDPTPEDETQPSLGVVAESEVVHVPLRRLVRAPENVRRTDQDVDAAEMAEDIAGHGLLQSLIGYDQDEQGRVGYPNELAESGFAWRDPADLPADEEARVFIVGGGRRLAGLERLLDLGRVDGDYHVPVQIRGRGEAVELSLAENLGRRNMNPVDEFRAFKQLMELHPGTVGITELAQRFGYTKDFVRARMRLADLAPDILDALSARKLTLDAAYAYASTQDLDVQLRVFKSQEKHWNPHSPDTIRQEIRGGTYSEQDPIVRYVGIEAYDAAGGRYEDSLFIFKGDEEGSRRLIDTKLVRELAKERAEAELPAMAKAVGYAALALTLQSDCYGNVTAPKPPKGHGKIERDYYAIDAKAIAAVIAKAKKKKIPITGVAHIDRDGKLVIYDKLIFLPKADADELRPKRETYRGPTPEQQEKARRTDAVEKGAARAAAHLLLGDLWHERVQAIGWYNSLETGNVPPHGEVVFMTARIMLTKAEHDAHRAAAEQVYDLRTTAMAKLAEMSATPRNVCRVCSCKEKSACRLEHGPCGWVDNNHTLCDNPACLTAIAEGNVSAPAPEPAAEMAATSTAEAPTEAEAAQ